MSKIIQEHSANSALNKKDGFWVYNFFNGNQNEEIQIGSIDCLLENEALELGNRFKLDFFKKSIKEKLRKKRIPHLKDVIDEFHKNNK